MNIKWYAAKILKYVLNPPALNKSTVAKHSKVCPGCEVKQTEIDKYSYVGSYSFLLKVKIGKFCSIGDRCRIGGSEHDITAVSTSPVFYEGKNIMNINLANLKYIPAKETVIENDVWIGAGSFIKSGVTIHTGAVVGMGSVVTHDVPPYEIWAGNPARKIKDRFDEALKQRLLESEWWNESEEVLRELGTEVKQPEIFLAKRNGQ